MEKNFRCGHQAKKTHCQNSKRIHDKIHHKHRCRYGKRDSTFFHEIGACRLPSRGGWSDGRKEHISCREQKTLYRISFITDTMQEAKKGATFTTDKAEHRKNGHDHPFFVGRKHNFFQIME